MAGKCCGNSGSVIRGGVDFLGNPSISVTGSGTAADPIEVSLVGVSVVDSPDLDLTLQWIPGEGYVLTGVFASGSKLDSLGDVVAGSPSNGDVIGFDTTTGKWTNRAPTTAAPGAISKDSSLNGDGSVGSPLGVKVDPAGGLASGASGVKLTDTVFEEIVRRYSSATARAADPIAPVLNSLSMLDPNPGRIDYWNGSAWLPINQFSKVDTDGTQYLSLSGAYDGRPLTLLTKSVTETTDSVGRFDVLTSADLTGYAGVLTVMVQPLHISGGLSWDANVFTPGANPIRGLARANDGTTANGVSISFLVTAWMY